MDRYIRKFEDIHPFDFPLVGKRNSLVGKTMHNQLSQKASIPRGFAVLTRAYQDILLHNNIKGKLGEVLMSEHRLDENGLKNISRKGKELILGGTFPYHLEVALMAAYELLQEQEGVNPSLTVFSSMVPMKNLQDIPTHPEVSLGNTSNVNELLSTCLDNYAYLFEEEPLRCFLKNNIDPLSVEISIGVQANSV